MFVSDNQIVLDGSDPVSFICILLLILSCVFIAVIFLALAIYIVARLEEKLTFSLRRREYGERLFNFLGRFYNTDVSIFTRKDKESILAFIKVMEDEYNNS